MTVHIYCIKSGCKNRPFFGNDDKIAKYCSQHKQKDMLYILSKCIEPSCEQRRYFGYLKERTVKYCFLHKKRNMIYLSEEKCIK